MGKRIKFKAGDVVFAKVKGFPYWPARISKKLKNNKFQVFFFGTYETSHLKALELLPYTPENKEQIVPKNSKKIGFLQGIEEIENTPEIAPIYPDEVAEAGTPKSLKKTKSGKLGSTPKGTTPMGKGAGKRKTDVLNTETPVAKKARLVEPEKISRSGRKIKPNSKWAEDGLIKAKVDSILQETASPGEVGDEVMVEGKGLEEVTQSVVNGVAKKGKDLKRKQINPNIKRMSSFKKAELVEEQTEREDNENVPMEHLPNYLFARVKKTEDIVQLSLHKEKTPKFKSPHDQMKWETSNVTKAIQLKKDIEDGSQEPPEGVQKLSEYLVLTSKDHRIYSEIKKKASYLEERKTKLEHLRIEKHLVALDDAIEQALKLKIPQPENCLKSLEDLLKLPLTPLILKKHPDIVKLIKRLRQFGKETSQNNKFISMINQKVDEIIESFKIKFKYVECYDGQDFFDEYDIQVAEFDAKTKHMEDMEIIGLITDPTIALMDTK